MDNFSLYVENALRCMKPSILMPLTLSSTEMNNIILTILNNHPDLFWFQGKWRLISAGKSNFAVPMYSFTFDEIAEAKEKVEIVVEMITNVKGSKIEIARDIFINLAKWCDYGEGICGGQTVYDALISRCAYCKGLSKAYQLLMKRVNVPCRIISGSLWKRGRHIWNEVQIDGKWYTVDVSTAYSIVRDKMKILSPIFCVNRFKLPSCYQIEDGH